jgi:hypothetical protein
VVDVLDTLEGVPAAEDGSEAVAEPMRLIGEAEVDQAVVDAEFVAIVLAEYPPSQGERVVTSVPPRSPIRSRRAHPAGPASVDQVYEPRSAAITSAHDGSRRRPGPGPRSPPLVVPLDTNAKEVTHRRKPL